MLILKTWRKTDFLNKIVKEYRMLLLFGIIPIFIWING